MELPEGHPPFTNRNVSASISIVDRVYKSKIDELFDKSNQEHTPGESQFDPKTEHEFDVWLSGTLNNLLRPVYEQTAEYSDTLTDFQFIDGFSYFTPTVVFPHPYSSLIDGNFTSMKTSENRKYVHSVHDFLMQYKPDISPEENLVRFKKLTSIDYIPPSVESFLLNGVPQDNDQRSALAEAIISFQKFSELTFDYQLSDDVATNMVTSEMEFLKNDPDGWTFPLRSLGSLPIWTEDPTITEDLFNAANILCLNIPFELAQEISVTNPLFLRTETARGKETNGLNPDTVTMIMQEGIFSIMQAINLGLGQLHGKSEFGSDEDIIQKIVDDSIPTQLARYLELGIVGPVNQYGFFIKDLIVSDDAGKFKVNPEYIMSARESKKAYSQAARQKEPQFSDKAKYLTARHDNSFASTDAGICPVSRNGENKSGIDILSNSLLIAFQRLRKLRAEEKIGQQITA